jgi:hypothetical protein
MPPIDVIDYFQPEIANQIFLSIIPWNISRNADVKILDIISLYFRNSKSSFMWLLISTSIVDIINYSHPNS